MLIETNAVTTPTQQELTESTADETTMNEGILL